MGRAPCCDKNKVKRGPWSPEEDTILKNYLHKHGTAGNWIALPPKAGLKRCGKSCRLRWLNYLRPDIKHGGFTEEEDNVILTLFNNIGSRWSVIASHLQGRTDNDVKNYWNTKLKKKFLATKTNLNPNNINGDHSTNYANNSMNFSSINPYYHENSTTQVITNSIDHHITYDHDSFINPNYQQSIIIPQTPVFRPIQIPVPKLMEVSDLGDESWNFSSISQEVSSSDNNYVSWSGFSCDLLDGFDFDQEKISELVYPRENQ